MCWNPRGFLRHKVSSEVELGERSAGQQNADGKAQTQWSYGPVGLYPRVVRRHHLCAMRKCAGNELIGCAIGKGLHLKRDALGVVNQCRWPIANISNRMVNLTPRGLNNWLVPRVVRLPLAHSLARQIVAVTNTFHKFYFW